jgi:hypothetical protein
MLIEFRIVCEGEHAVKKRLESLYRNLLNGKLPHNLSWAEAVELVEHLGQRFSTIEKSWKRSKQITPARNCCMSI